MLNCKVGETLCRITPPVGTSEGFCQSGTVVEVSDELITLSVQADVIRRMEFSRKTGMDTSGLGSFLVRPDYLTRT